MNPTLKRIETPLYTVSQIRDREVALFAQTSSFAVMQQAATAMYEVIASDFPFARQTVHVLLGAGNNAGDGLIVGALLKQSGFRVYAYTTIDATFHGDTKKAFELARAESLNLQPFFPFAVQADDIIVEAIFGIGLNRSAEGTAKKAIEYLNACKAAYPSICVYAVDIPAGILSDTGASVGATVQADKTITFIGDKVGLHTADGKGVAGKISVSTLTDKALPAANHFRYQYAAPHLTAHHNAHKGDYGHALIIGGGRGMFGATALAAVSSLKVGAGKASIYSHSDYASQYYLDNTPLYEVMKKADFDNLSLYSALILGVGLGRDDWGRAVYEQTIQAIDDQQNLLIDADGLWHLEEHSTPKNLRIITPHEGEASRLLDCRVETIRSHKPAAVRQLAQKYACIAVLKGAGTLISDGQTVWVNESGNACLATAGTGDVLAGMIGGYLAQGFEALEAALYGVFRHGQAADAYWAQHRDKTLRASDLWLYL